MSYTITLLPGKHRFACRSDETLLEAAEAAGFSVPASCRNGVCWICEATLIEGRVEDSSQPEKPETGEEIRLCRSFADSDVVLETHRIHPQREITLNTFACQIATIEPFNAHVHRVRLRTPAGTLPEFSPGQYLSLDIPDTESAFFSIASQPGERLIELHIEAPEGRDSAIEILAYLKSHLTVKVSLPFGKACLNRLPPAFMTASGALLPALRDARVLLIAAGTGFAQVKSLAEAFFRMAEPPKAIDLFWGGRTAEDLYDRSEPGLWQQMYPRFAFHPALADKEDNAWQGHHDQLVELVMKQKDVINNLHAGQTLVYASGSPGLVYTAMDALLERGLDSRHFFSDVLEYAPR